MPHRPLLTIGIPTINRSALLCQAIDSIVRQIDHRTKDSVSILVSDNASTDDTPTIMKAYTTKYDYIQYHRNQTNIGDDLNGETIIQNAPGKFVWFLADDDLIKKGAIQSILQILTEVRGLSLILTNWTDIDTEENIINHTAHIFKADQLHSNPEDAFTSANLMYGFMSCVIVRSKLWKDIQERSKYYGTHLSLMYIVPRLMLAGKTYIVAKPSVFFRHGNVKTWTQESDYTGPFLNSQISIPSITRDATRNAFARHIIFKTLYRNYSRIFLRDIIALKSSRGKLSWQTKYKLARLHYHKISFWMLFPLLLVPRCCFLILKSAKRCIKTTFN